MFRPLMHIFNVDYPFSPFDTYPLLNRILLIAFRYSGFFFEIFLSLLMPCSFPVWIPSPFLKLSLCRFSFSHHRYIPQPTLTMAFAFLRSPLLSRSLSPLRLFGPPFAGSCRALVLLTSASVLKHSFLWLL